MLFQNTICFSIRVLISNDSSLVSEFTLFCSEDVTLNINTEFLFVLSWGIIWKKKKGAGFRADPRAKKYCIYKLLNAPESCQSSFLFLNHYREGRQTFLSIHKLIMLENKASGCSHASESSERLFTVTVSKIKSVFQTSFFQGYSETNAILFPCENVGVSWHIFMARWRKFALNLFWFFDVS